jgi:hypothetical protein
VPNPQYNRSITSGPQSAEFLDELDRPALFPGRIGKVSLGAWAIVAIDGADGRRRGREQASPYGEREGAEASQPVREHLRGVIELKTHVVSAASSLAPGHVFHKAG